MFKGTCEACFLTVSSESEAKVRSWADAHLTNSADYPGDCGPVTINEWDGDELVREVATIGGGGESGDGTLAAAVGGESDD